MPSNWDNSVSGGLAPIRAFKQGQEVIFLISTVMWANKDNCFQLADHCLSNFKNALENRLHGPEYLDPLASEKPHPFNVDTVSRLWESSMRDTCGVSDLHNLTQVEESALRAIPSQFAPYVLSLTAYNARNETLFSCANVRFTPSYDDKISSLNFSWEPILYDRPKRPEKYQGWTEKKTFYIFSDILENDMSGLVKIACPLTMVPWAKSPITQTFLAGFENPLPESLRTFLRETAREIGEAITTAARLEGYLDSVWIMDLTGEQSFESRLDARMLAEYTELTTTLPPTLSSEVDFVDPPPEEPMMLTDGTRIEIEYFTAPLTVPNH